MAREDSAGGLNVWFVSRAFPPTNAIGVERAKKFLNSFVDSGFSSLIFTVEQADRSAIRSYRGARVRRSRVLLAGAFDAAAGRPPTVRSKLSRFAARLVTVLFDDSGWTWMPGLRDDLDRALIECGKPDVVIATGRPFLTFLTVSSFARRHGIPYILDYRDAWAKNPHPSLDTWARRALAGWLEGRVNRHASAIVTVSELTGQALNTDTKPHVIYNLPDESYVKELGEYASNVDPISVERLTLAFTGTLYPGRDLDPVCEAIARLEPRSRERIEVHYCGDSGSRAEASFRRHGIEQCLVSHGSLSKQDAVRLVAASDIALSVICSESSGHGDAMRGVITTKVFDYMILGRTVLNIVPSGFEFNSVAGTIAASSLVSHEPGDVAGIARFLLASLEAKQESPAALRGGSDVVAALTDAWGRQMDGFNALLEKLV